MGLADDYTITQTPCLAYHWCRGLAGRGCDSINITRKIIVDWGGEAVYKQAERLVQKGAVARADINGNIISGVILREGAPQIHSRFKVLNNGRIENLCPCYTNQHQGLVCQHVVALGITIMLRRSDPLREQRYQEEQRRARRMMEKSTLGKLAKRSRQGVPVQLRLILPDKWITAFYQGQIKLRLEYEVGSKHIPADQLPEATQIALNPEQDNLLMVLEDICEGAPPAAFVVSPSDLLNIFAIVPEQTLFNSQLQAVNTRNPRLSACLRIDLDPDNGELIVYPFADLPAAPPGELPRFIVSGEQGYLHLGNSLWPLARVLPLPYHPVYMSNEIIPRESVPSFLQRTLPALKKTTDVEMELPVHAFDITPGHPQFTITLQGSRASLRASLVACYGGSEFRAGSPESVPMFVTPDPDDILKYHTRNSTAENRAIKMLQEYGFERSEHDFILIGEREVLNFLGSGQQFLRRHNWKIIMIGAINQWIETLNFITPVVSVCAGVAGWFEVAMEFEDINGKALPATDIQRAINQGNSFFEYQGTTMMLDTEAVESMRVVFHDCRSRSGSTPGSFQVPEVYAPFVEASLGSIDGIDIEVPAEWHHKIASLNRDRNLQIAPVPLGTLDQTLRPYQKEGVYWLRFMEQSGLHGVLADEMGLGKTLQTLAWLNLPRATAQAEGKPVLIVCPTSLVENWSREAATFVPHMSRLIISGVDRHKLFAQITTNNLVITSYALLRRDLEYYNAYSFSVLVLDEAQHIKNRSTRNAVAAKQIRAENRLVLTGTPVENSVSDIWSIMDFLMPEYLGDYESFRLHYELPISTDTREGVMAQHKLKHKLHPFILRRLKKEVAKDLPDKIVKVSYCQLSEEQQRVYNQLITESRSKVKDMLKAQGFERSRFEILAMLMRLRQASCHLNLLKNRGQPGNYTNPSAKMEAFFEILDEAVDGGHRILVFSQFVAMLQLLRSELEQQGLAYCYLDGTTKNRLEECQCFNSNPDIPVFLISLKAGGTGLNLTGADMVVHFDPWWNPAVEDQATDRAHRIGQQRTVYSIKLIAEHTVEERVLAMQQRKQAIIDATIGATDAAVMSKMSLQDIQELLEI